jgi:hypothetical protein
MTRTRNRAIVPTTTASPTGGRHHRVLSPFAAVNAESAYSGAVGLATGGINLSSKLTSRLPFGSPVLGAVALTVVVAIPLSALAVLAWRGDAATDRASVVVGVTLIAWNGVELAFGRSVEA